MLTTWTGKHTVEVCQEKRIHTLLHSQNSEPVRADTQEPLGLLLSNGEKSLRRPHKRGGRRRHETNDNHERQQRMTVCAAAICTFHISADRREQIVMGIADRMLTSRGDVEFEPRTAKIYACGFNQQPARISFLSADDTDLAFDLAKQTHQELMKRTGEISVRDAAFVYGQKFAILRRERAEVRYLTPLGLDAASLVAKQRQMNPGLVDQMQNEELAVESLVVGVDDDGPHIYHVYDPGTVVCRDRSAFWAIGLGGRHFENQFMSLGYDCHWSMQDATLLMYTAKRKAELAPGVGRATDMFHIGKTRGMIGADPEVLGAVDEHYRYFEERVKEQRAETVKRMLADRRIYGAAHYKETDDTNTGVNPSDPVSNT